MFCGAAAGIGGCSWAVRDFGEHQRRQVSACHGDGGGQPQAAAGKGVAKIGFGILGHGRGVGGQEGGRKQRGKQRGKQSLHELGQQVLPAASLDEQPRLEVHAETAKRGEKRATGERGARREGQRGDGGAPARKFQQAVQQRGGEADRHANPLQPAVQHGIDAELLQQLR